MIKYRNLRLMTSAWSPKRLPPALLHYLRDARHGPHPLRLGLPRPVDAALPRRGPALDLTPEVRDAWLYRNAEAFFFEAPASPGAPEEQR